MRHKKTVRRGIQIALEREFGPDSELLIQQLKRIALGQAIEVDSDLPGAKKRLVPTLADVHSAVLDLLAYQHGKPVHAVDVVVEEVKERWNPDLLTWGELEQLDRLVRKASLGDGIVVEGRTLPEKSQVGTQGCPDCLKNGGECKIHNLD